MVADCAGPPRRGELLLSSARVIGQLRLEVHAKASGTALVGLAVSLLAAAPAWTRVMAEACDFNWHSMLSLLSLLGRVALLPLALLVLALRTGWGRAGVGDLSYKHGGVNGEAN